MRFSSFGLLERSLASELFEHSFSKSKTDYRMCSAFTISYNHFKSRSGKCSTSANAPLAAAGLKPQKLFWTEI